MNIHIHHFHSRGAVADQSALEQFQKQWATYQKLVDTDALAHKEVGGDPAPRACGDPQALRLCRHCLRRRGPDEGRARRHQGQALSRIDLSEPALELAAKNLAGVPFEVELDHRDVVPALTKRPEPADAAWCGLSIHHLSTEGKVALLKAIHGSTSGFLMIYEPTLLDGEDREGYLERFRRVIRPAWTFMTEDEWEQIDHHVTTCDYPETSATWCALRVSF
jgi:hypothetical protein